MPATRSTDGPGQALEPATTTVEPPEAPHSLRVLVDTRSDESLIARFVLGYRDRTCAAYLADLGEGPGVAHSPVHRPD